MNNPKLPRCLLQASLAFVFLYAAAAATLHPHDWVGYLPQFLKTFAPLETFLKLFSFIQLVLGLWLISSYKLFWAALFATVMLLGITFANLTLFDLTFRDLGLALASLALVFLSKDSK